MVLTCFKAVIGLTVNLVRVKWSLWGEADDVVALADILCCKVLLMNYLGMPLGPLFKDRTVWNPILEKRERRLAGQKPIFFPRRKVDSLEGHAF